MSTQSLLRFLERIDEDLFDETSEKRLIYNLRTHTFVYSEENFIKEFLQEMSSKQVDAPGLEGYVKGIAPLMTTKLRETLLAMTIKASGGGKKQSAAANFKEVGGELSFVFTTDVRTGLPPNAWAQGQKDVFDKIKRAYHKAYGAFFHGVRDFVKKTSESDSNRFEAAYVDKAGRVQKGRAMHSGHAWGQGVVETRMREAFDTHKKTVRQKDNARKCLAEEDLIKDLEKLGIDLEFMRDPKTGTMTFQVSMEGATGNILRGQEMRQKLNDVRNRVSELVRNPKLVREMYGDLKGSDTLGSVDRKTIIKNIAKQFKKNPYVTVITEDTKINAKKKTVNKKVDGAKVTRGKRGKFSDPTLPRTASGREKDTERSKFNVQNIIGVINSQLQDRVGQKMVSPRLENRSGRFLDSVRATDVTQTAQGYPSIGYTYARDPYEVYETGSGSRFASAYRDPRLIIDQSIREIVSQFGLGRLYTRRQ